MSMPGHNAVSSIELCCRVQVWAQIPSWKIWTIQSVHCVLRGIKEKLMLSKLTSCTKARRSNPILDREHICTFTARSLHVLISDLSFTHLEMCGTWEPREENAIMCFGGAGLFRMSASIYCQHAGRQNAPHLQPFVASNRMATG